MEHETDQGHVMMCRSGILRGLFLCCLLALLALPPAVSFAQTVSFEAATPFPVGSVPVSVPVSVAVGDFNRLSREARTRQIRPQSGGIRACILGESTAVCQSKSSTAGEKQQGRGAMVARLGAVQPGVIDLQQVNDQAR